jgi:hypothetical protein
MQRARCAAQPVALCSAAATIRFSRNHTLTKRDPTTTTRTFLIEGKLTGFGTTSLEPLDAVTNVAGFFCEWFGVRHCDESVGQKRVS